jgi:ABC-2 type transport system ATP-binding protein
MGLQVRGLTVRYGRRIAVAGLDLDVPDGAITGFLGHNGAGKTSAMRGILGLTPGVTGQVLVDGHDGFRDPAERLARVGALIEAASFQAGWSARRNLVELARLQGLGRLEARREADLRLEQVGLVDAAGRDPAHFSQGMRQRMGLAQALLGGRRVLLLDEPTNGLDPEGIAELWSLLRKLRDEEGAAVLLSSHLLAEVDALCDRVAVLREGELVASGGIETLRRASGDRHLLVARAPERARAVLERVGVGEVAVGDHGALEFDLGGRDAADVLTALVSGDARPTRFGPAAGGLTAVYRAAAEGRLTADLEPVLLTEGERRARGSGFARLIGFERRRLWRSTGWLLAPALAGVLPVLGQVRKAAAARAEVEGQTLFSATEVTAFRAGAEGLELGVPLAALLAALGASQLVAGELGRGTLRNVALRPLSRLELGLGKLVAAAGMGLASVGAAVLGAVGAAAAFFDFGDLEEVLVTGDRFPIMPAAEVWPEFKVAVSGAFAVGLAFAGLGLLCGSITRRGVAAFGLSLSLFLGLTVGRWFSAGADNEWLNPATYLPSLAADASHVHAVAVLASGATNVPFEHGGSEFSVPLVTFLLCAVASLWSVRRRAIP